ncbi:CsgG/HfaB family protein [Thermosynechococcaceae cyanobacterium BACA0444]|uniref:CsgG/HfaB family protein n=2 Tax=Pseudocalidococcus TaxID=3110321 RepID=A0AAE4JYP3_9CYAN|nr:CsgG/HfaB family protein [Pseudocalidococcus azoricus BACA0444]
MGFGLLVTTTLALLQIDLPRVTGANLAINQTVAWSQPNPARRRIAVLDFEFASTGLTGAGLGSGDGSYGPSKGVSDLLTNKLVQSGNFIVVERSQIEKIIQEQNLGTAGRVDAATAAQIGRILGVDVVILGSITKFNVEQKQSGGFGGVGIAVSVNESKANAIVQLTARLVSTSTAEILAVAQGEGQTSKRENQVSVAGFGGGSNTNNIDSLLSGAAEIAVSQLVTEINSNAEKISLLPAVQPSLNAVIADVTGAQITLNRGGNDGYRPGMKLRIERVVKEVKDPTNGQVLRTITQPIGQMTLTEVDARSSLGIVNSGVGIKVGDVAKPISASP